MRLDLRMLKLGKEIISEGALFFQRSWRLLRVANMNASEDGATSMWEETSLRCSPFGKGTTSSNPTVLGCQSFTPLKMNMEQQQNHPIEIRNIIFHP